MYYSVHVDYSNALRSESKEKRKILLFLFKLFAYIYMCIRI